MRAMKRHYTVLPRGSASVELQDRIRATLERPRIFDELPQAASTFVWVEGPIEAGATLDKAHGVWQAAYLQQVETPGRLPRQPLDAKCPDGIIRVAVECIARRNEGMSSYYGFEGYFASWLLLVNEQVVWDARGEKAG